jgi:outer membrane receptor protein involved in Fe transport
MGQAFLIYANVRADIGAVGDFYGTIGTDGIKLGDYTTLDLSFTVDVKDISLRFFVNNATNEAALTWSNSFLPVTNLFVLRPRTVGLNARYYFGDN